MTTLGAFGADGTITGGANTCTVEVLGVHENDAIANTIATWTLNKYECSAGQYLLNSDGTLECTECPIGSYCPGGEFTVESESNGANACPTDYTSDAGSVGENECYTGCELACTQQTCPEHSENCTHGVSSTTGKQYVNSTCNAEKTFCSIDFECAPGYNKIIVDPEFVFSITSDFLYCELDNTHNASWSPEASFIGVNSCDILKPGEIIQGDIEKIEDGFVKYKYFTTDIGPDTTGVITKKFYYDNNPTQERNLYYLYSTDFVENPAGEHLWIKPVSVFLPTSVAKMVKNITTPYSETDPMWRQLRASVSETEFELFKSVIDKYFTLGLEGLKTITPEEFWNVVTMQTVEIPLNIPYIYQDSKIFEVFEKLYERNPIYEYFTNNGATYCMNNTININWNPDNGTDALQSMCMYNAGLAVPEDPVKPGYVFSGWKLLENTTTE